MFCIFVEIHIMLQTFIYKYSRQCIWLILLAAILTFFEQPIQQLLNFFVVKPFFKVFSIGEAGKVFLVALLIGYVYWSIKVLDRKTLHRIAIYSFGFYAFQRAGSGWEFYPFLDRIAYDSMQNSLFNYLKYWDMVELTLVIPAVIAIFQKEREMAVFSENPEGFVQDNPIELVADDSFGRNNVASQIAFMIGLTNNRRSFAIGILGEYGSGKTSFLNLINQGLPAGDYVKVKFNPWNSENSSFIHKDFFDQLVNTIANIDLRASSLLHAYSRKISRVDDASKTWINRINLLSNLAANESSHEKDKINKALQRSEKKIIITIDDLDRLHNDEVIEVLRIIGNTADFTNVFYLVAYEKGYVQNALKTLNDKGNRDYLDKIFQLEIPLPKRDENALIDYLKLKIKPLLSSEHLTILDEKLIALEFNNKYDEALSTIFRHSRDVIKFVNGFKMVYKLIGYEVDFEDLFVLELLKFRFQLIYDHIYERKDDFIHLQPSMAHHQEFYVATGNTVDEDSVSNFSKFSETTELIQKGEVKLVNRLFSRLFKGGSWYRPESKNGISYPLYFEIYFRQRLSVYDLSDRDFRAAIKSGNLDRFINQCVSRNLHQAILTRLFQEEPISTNRIHYEKIIRGIFHLGPQYVGKTSSTAFPYNQLIDLLTNHYDQIVGKIYNDDAAAFERFVRNLFNSAEPTYLFESQMIYHIRESRRQFVINNDDLSDMQIGFFKEYVSSNHGLNKDAVWIFWGIREYNAPETSSGQNRESHWRFIPKVITRLKQALKESDIAYFLETTIRRNLGEDKMAGIVPQIIDMFDDISEFRTIIDENVYLNEAVKLEYLDFFDRLSAISFSHVVSVDFKTTLAKN